MLFVLFHVFEILLKATTGFWHRWMVHNWVSFSVSHMCMSFQIKRRQLLELLSQIVLSDFTLWILWNFTVDFWWRQMGRRIRGVFRLCLWTCSYWVMLLFQGYSWCLLIFIIQSLCLIHMVIFIIFIFIFYCYFLGSCRTWIPSFLYLLLPFCIWSKPLLSMRSFQRQFGVESFDQRPVLFENVSWFLDNCFECFFRQTLHILIFLQLFQNFDIAFGSFSIKAALSLMFQCLVGLMWFLAQAAGLWQYVTKLLFPSKLIFHIVYIIAENWLTYESVDFAGSILAFWCSVVSCHRAITLHPRLFNKCCLIRRCTAQAEVADAAVGDWAFLPFGEVILVFRYFEILARKLCTSLHILIFLCGLLKTYFSRTIIVQITYFHIHHALFAQLAYCDELLNNIFKHFHQNMLTHSCLRRYFSQTQFRNVGFWHTVAQRRNVVIIFEKFEATAIQEF